MSSNLGRLRLLFQHKPTTAPKPAAALPSTKTAPVAPTTSIGNKQLEYFVQRFKEKSSLSSHFRRSTSSYKAAVRRLADARRFSSVHDILNHQKQFPEIQNEKFTTRLILLYGKAKMLDHARKLFDEMPDLNCPRTILSVNYLMAACFPSKKFDKVIELFQELPEKLSVKPDVTTYGMAVRAHCEMRSLYTALSLFNEIEEKGLEPDAMAFSSLLRAFYGSGRYDEAEEMWRLMEEKNVVPNLKCYNSRLFGIVRERKPGAMELLEEMKEKGLKPNHYTYNLMIRWSVDEGDLEEVKRWCATMVDNGLDPDFITLSMVIPFACEKEVDFAYELLRKKSEGVNVRISRNPVQMVINKLVEESKVDKAKELVELYASKDLVLELDKPQVTVDE